MWILLAYSFKVGLHFRFKIDVVVLICDIQESFRLGKLDFWSVNFIFGSSVLIQK